MHEANFHNLVIFADSAAVRVLVPLHFAYYNAYLGQKRYIFITVARSFRCSFSSAQGKDILS